MRITPRLDPLTAYEERLLGATDHLPSLAFEQGYDAADAGHPITANPYTKLPGQNEWKAGHQAWTIEHS